MSSSLPFNRSFHIYETNLAMPQQGVLNLYWLLSHPFKIQQTFWYFWHKPGRVKADSPLFALTYTCSQVQRRNLFPLTMESSNSFSPTGRCLHYSGAKSFHHVFPKWHLASRLGALVHTTHGIILIMFDHGNSLTGDWLLLDCNAVTMHVNAWNIMLWLLYDCRLTLARLWQDLTRHSHDCTWISIFTEDERWAMAAVTRMAVVMTRWWWWCRRGNNKTMTKELV